MPVFIFFKNSLRSFRDSKLFRGNFSLSFPQFFPRRHSRDSIVFIHFLYLLFSIPSPNSVPLLHYSRSLCSFLVWRRALSLHSLVSPCSLAFSNRLESGRNGETSLSSPFPCISVLFAFQRGPRSSAPLLDPFGFFCFHQSLHESS